MRIQRCNTDSQCYSKPETQDSLLKNISKVPSINVPMVNVILRKQPKDDKTTNLIKPDKNLNGIQNMHSENITDLNKRILKKLVIDRMLQLQDVSQNPQEFYLKESELKNLTNEVAAKFQALTDVVSTKSNTTEFLRTIKEINNDFREISKRRDGLVIFRFFLIKKE